MPICKKRYIAAICAFLVPFGAAVNGLLGGVPDYILGTVAVKLFSD